MQHSWRSVGKHVQTQSRGPDEPPARKLPYRDKSAEVDLQATEITSLVVDGESAWIQGIGTIKPKQSVHFSADLAAAELAFGLRVSSGYTVAGAIGGNDMVELDGSCPFEGAVSVARDAGSAASASIGPAGGSLAAGGVTLAVPAGALLEDRLITVTPIIALDGSPLGGLIAGATLEPEGLVLLKPATLSFPVPAGANAAEVVAFGFAAGGDDLHLVPRRVDAGQIELDVWHFSGAGGAFGPVVNGVPTWIPGTAETRARHEIALAALACQQQQVAAPSGPWPLCDLFPNYARLALDAWYDASVKPGLTQALGAPSFQVEEAFHEWLQWRGEVEIQLGTDFGFLAPKLVDATGLATAALADLTKRRLQNCTGTDLQSQLRDVARMADLADAGTIDLTTEGLPDVALLVDACAGIRIDPPTFPAMAARETANRLSVHAFVGTYTGAQLTTVPLQLSLAVSRGSSNSSGGPLDVQGRFETTVSPFAGVTNVTLDITVELAAGALPTLSPEVRPAPKGVQLTRSARDRMEVDGPGSPLSSAQSAPVLARLAGDDLIGRRIDFAIVSGPGTLSAPTATTGASGEASVNFTAPTSGGGTSAVRVTFDDGGNLLSRDITIGTVQSIAVTVSPATVTAAPGGTVQFTATVQNTTNNAVGWGATGGTIDQNGLYTAGSTPGTFSVAAASVEDPNAVGSATVTIASADWSGLYAGTWGQCTGYPVATCYAPTVPWTFRVTRTADRISLYFLEFPWCYPLTLAENFGGDVTGNTFVAYATNPAVYTPCGTTYVHPRYYRLRGTLTGTQIALDIDTGSKCCGGPPYNEPSIRGVAVLIGP
jgi:hypothetical protein